MNTKLLKDFLYDSNLSGYTSGQERQWIKEKDGSTTISYEKGDFRSNDNYFGGEPYGGRIIVFYKGKPCWIMVYYGFVKKGIEPNKIYPVLQGALRQMPKEYPFRGPNKYEQDKYIYTNTWEGDVEYYSGKEYIKQDKETLYKATYLGGLVER